MASAKRLALYVAVALLAGAIGYFANTLWRGASHPEVPRAAQIVQEAARGVIGSRRPDFTLPDLQGKTHAIGEWDGKVVLVNFWATWCPPCRREIPELIRAFEQHAPQDFVVLGIAIDSQDAVRSYVEQAGVTYPQLWGDADASALSLRFGNRYGALPFSVLIDRDGIVRFVHAGELHRATLERELSRLL